MENIKKDPSQEQVNSFMRLARKMKLEVVTESRKRLEQKVQHLYERNLIKKEDYDNFLSLTKDSIREVEIYKKGT